MNLQQEKALRAIAAGARTIAQLRAATSSVAWSAMRPVLQGLIDEGLVSRGRGTAISLSAAGRALVAPAPPAPMKPYVPPPAAARRPGADDWERLPSIAAGVEIPKKP